MCSYSSELPPQSASITTAIPDMLQLEREEAANEHNNDDGSALGFGPEASKI